jgi:hypothetical protein
MYPARSSNNLVDFYLTVRRFIQEGGKDKVISVTGRGGPWVCEMSRLPHFLESRLTDGGEVVSITLRPNFNPKKIPGTQLC